MENERAAAAMALDEAKKAGGNSQERSKLSPNPPIHTGGRREDSGRV